MSARRVRVHFPNSEFSTAELKRRTDRFVAFHPHLQWDNEYSVDFPYVTITYRERRDRYVPFDAHIGPIWNKNDANKKAAAYILAHPYMKWTGQWRTIKECEDSVINVVFTRERLLAAGHASRRTVRRHWEEPRSTTFTWGNLFRNLLYLVPVVGPTAELWHGIEELREGHTVDGIWDIIFGLIGAIADAIAVTTTFGIGGIFTRVGERTVEAMGREAMMRFCGYLARELTDEVLESLSERLVAAGLRNANAKLIRALLRAIEASRMSEIIRIINLLIRRTVRINQPSSSSASSSRRP